MAGVSRSATIVVAYIMTITNLSFNDAISAVCGAREVVDPNAGFIRQLQEYENSKLLKEVY